MKIVFLERKSIGYDIELDYFNKLGEVSLYENTTKSQVGERIKDADVIIANKVLLDKESLGEANNLKLICLTATGTNNVDFSYTNAKNIRVCNVSSYSTNSVVQHTFALLFYLYEKLNHYDNYVKSGDYAKSDIFSNFFNTFHELHGKKWGIIGLGEIGRSVASIAKAFGCEVSYYSTSGKNNNSDYTRCELDDLLKESDIVSIHAPLNDDTLNLISEKEFKMMKNTAYIINVGRGSIINEKDLANALINGEIEGAGLDVLEKEPISKDNPLMDIKDSSKLLITPHMAWGTIEARVRLMQEVYKNIEAFTKNEERNVVR